MPVSSYEFIQRKKNDWEKLNLLIKKIKWKGLKSLTAEELENVGELYQRICSDLAYTKTYLNDRELQKYLNNLAARTYNYIYVVRAPKISDFKKFFLYQFPLLFRQYLNFILLAQLIFLAFLLIGLFLSFSEEGFIYLMVPPHILEKIEHHLMWTDKITTLAPLASSAIITNNISVSIAAFALGLTAGIGTFYILSINGMLLGCIIYLVTIHGLGLEFLSFILPHGIIELSVIFIAAGAGFILTHAQLFPGDLKRKDALRIKGKDAVRLLLGCIPFLLLAGIFEGFISPSSLPPIIKIIFALIIGASFFYYLFAF